MLGSNPKTKRIKSDPYVSGLKAAAEAYWGGKKMKGYNTVLKRIIMVLRPVTIAV